MSDEIEERYAVNLADASLMIGLDGLALIAMAEQGNIDAVRDAAGTIWIDPDSVEHLFAHAANRPDDAPPLFTPLPPPKFATMEKPPSPVRNPRLVKREHIDLSHHDEMEHDGEMWCRRSFHEAELQRITSRERVRLLEEFREAEQATRDQAKRLQAKLDRLVEEHRDDIEAIRRRNREEIEAMAARHRVEIERERDQHRADQDAHAKRKELWVEIETERAKERVRSADAQLADAVRARIEAEAKAAKAEAALVESRAQWMQEQVKAAEERAVLKGKLATAGRQSERVQEIEGIAALTKIAADAPESTKPMIMAAVAQSLGLPPATTWDRILEVAAANPEALGELFGKVASIAVEKLGLVEKNPPAPEIQITANPFAEKKTGKGSNTGPREV
jgi:chemotaxis protein histidine kinase CheA